MKLQKRSSKRARTQMQTVRSSWQPTRPKNIPPPSTPKSWRKKRRAINFLP